jgi:hypothetical protein
MIALPITCDDVVSAPAQAILHGVSVPAVTTAAPAATTTLVIPVREEFVDGKRGEANAGDHARGCAEEAMLVFCGASCGAGAQLTGRVERRRRTGVEWRGRAVVIVVVVATP